MDASWDGGVSHTIFRSLTLTSDVISRIIMFVAYLILFEVGTQMWFVDASLDGGVSHTIFGSL